MYFLLDDGLNEDELRLAVAEQRELQEQQRWDTSFARLVQAERLRHL